MIRAASAFAASTKPTTCEPVAGTLGHLIEQSQRQLEEEKARLTKLEGQSSDTVENGPNSARGKQRADLINQIDLEDELQRLRDKGIRGQSAADAQRREQLAGELALRNSLKENGDQIVAQREKERAVAHETAEVDKQNLAARTKAIKQFEAQVVGAEGGSGRNRAGSSAAGFGQFTESTYLSLYKQTYGGGGLTDKQILATRFQESIAKGIIDAYTRQNAAFLDHLGAKVTAGNLYLTHFFGATPLAKQVLDTKNDNVPIDQLVNQYGGKNAGQILGKNQSYLRSNGGKGDYRTAAQVRAFLASRVGADGETGAAQSEGEVALDHTLEEAEKRQRELNLAVREGNEERARSVDALRDEAGLFGTALLAEQRRQAIIAAEAALRKQVDDKNKDLEAYAAVVALLKVFGITVPTASVGSHHTGGVAGQATTSRAVDPAWFAGAMRYHTGGVAGLAANEVPAILQRGEEVLTTSDPRHRANGGGQSAPSGGDLKIVNNFDPADLLSNALGTKAGERVILNHVRQNSRAYKQAIGGN